MKSRNTILIYVAKIEGVTGENFVIQCNVYDSFYLTIPTKLKSVEGEIANRASIIFTELFNRIKVGDKFKEFGDKSQFKLIFNEEYSVIGFMQSHMQPRKIKNGITINPIQLLNVSEVELKKPMDLDEIRIFLNAVKKIPTYRGV